MVRRLGHQVDDRDGEVGGERRRLLHAPAHASTRASAQGMSGGSAALRLNSTSLLAAASQRRRPPSARGAGREPRDGGEAEPALVEPEVELSPEEEGSPPFPREGRVEPEEEARAQDRPRDAEADARKEGARGAAGARVADMVDVRAEEGPERARGSARGAAAAANGARVRRNI